MLPSLNNIVGAKKNGYQYNEAIKFKSREKDGIPTSMARPALKFINDKCSVNMMTRY